MDRGDVCFYGLFRFVSFVCFVFGFVCFPSQDPLCAGRSLRAASIRDKNRHTYTHPARRAENAAHRWMSSGIREHPQASHAAGKTDRPRIAVPVPELLQCASDSTTQQYGNAHRYQSVLPLWSAEVLFCVCYWLTEWLFIGYSLEML